MRIVKWLLPYFIILAVIVTALSLNKYCIRQVNPANTSASSLSLTPGGTVWSIDNMHYDQQFKNWMDHGSFSIDPRHPEYKVRRTPLYPIILGAPVYFFGPQAGFWMICILQIILHLLATYFFGQIVLLLTGSERLRTIGLFVYGLCPFIFIYTNYTITESLTPFFVTTVLYCFVNYCRSGNRISWLVWTGITLALATLHRPLLILAALPLGAYVSVRRGTGGSFRLRVLHAAILLGAFILGMAPWVIRNYIVSKELVLTEKWYYEDPMFYGRSHTYLRTWINSFTNPANDLSTEVLVEQIRSAKDESETGRIIEGFMQRIPAWVFEVNDRGQVEAALRDYASCQKERSSITDSDPATSLALLGNRECEYESKQRFVGFAADIQKKSSLKYYLLIPGKTFLRDGIVHSFSSPWAMLNAPCLPGVLVKALKAGFLLLNVGLWASLFLYAVRRKRPFETGIGLALAGVVAIFVVFHIFVFRYFESRYFLPFYPILLLFFVCLLPGRTLTSKQAAGN